MFIFVLASPTQANKFTFPFHKHKNRCIASREIKKFRAHSHGALNECCFPFWTFLTTTPHIRHREGKEGFQMERSEKMLQSFYLHRNVFFASIHCSFCCLFTSLWLFFAFFSFMHVIWKVCLCNGFVIKGIYFLLSLLLHYVHAECAFMYTMLSESVRIFSGMQGYTVQRYEYNMKIKSIMNNLTSLIHFGRRNFLVALTLSLSTSWRLRRFILLNTV